MDGDGVIVFRGRNDTCFRRCGSFTPPGIPGVELVIYGGGVSSRGPVLRSRKLPTDFMSGPLSAVCISHARARARSRALFRH